MTTDAETKAPNAGEAERARLEARWPKEYRLGYRFGFLGKADKPHDSAGYPIGLAAWPIDRKNAWWCGWNDGRCYRNRLIAELRK
jgi:hypothetical protein